MIGAASSSHTNFGIEPSKGDDIMRHLLDLNVGENVSHHSAVLFAERDAGAMTNSSHASLINRTGLSIVMVVVIGITPEH